MIRSRRFPSTALTTSTTTPALKRDAVGRTNKAVAGAISIGSAIFALYLLEGVLAFASPAWVDKLGTTLRKGPSVIAETVALRERGVKAYPYLQPDTFSDSINVLHLAGSDSTVLPLAPIPNQLTVLCNESGTTIGYRSDPVGFRNPAAAWASQPLDAAIIGDSFAQGFCRPEDETVAAQLRANGFSVINAGLTGAGPLAELGVLREYVRSRNPRVVYWLFYEGNDLIDLTSERKTSLIGYMDPAYTQRLMDRRDAVGNSMIRYADSVIAAYHTPGARQKLWSFLLLRRLRTATGLYRQPPVQQADETLELQLLKSILARAQSETASWNGQLRIVYLPERRRFNTRTRAVTGENHDPEAVRSAVRNMSAELGIRFIDIAAEFARDESPARFWNARRYHYNGAGYALVADAIAADLRLR